MKQQDKAPVEGACPLPPLDGIRGMAAVFVVLCHSKYAGFGGGPTGMGTFGVMLFFCLSGFLMVHRNLPRRSSFTDWTAFEIQRFIRVYPPFFLATFSVLMLSATELEGSPFTTDWHDLIPIWMLREPGGIFWTITVELKFYLVYPLIALIRPGVLWMDSLRTGRRTCLDVRLLLFLRQRKRSRRPFAQDSPALVPFLS